MKVFTVGMDQKAKEADALPEKIPPPPFLSPDYMAAPTGQSIIVRKSRGYKGILLVMLTVFVIALFALMISEISYNRQRDDKFFKLRWAELKRRADFNDELRRERLMGSLIKNRETEFLAKSLVATELPATGNSPALSMEPVVMEQSRSSSSEQEPSTEFAAIQESRLQFLKKILAKIKEHVEDMGFDGTMQVSVLAMEPQVDEIQTQKVISDFPRSSSLMDGFGEMRQQAFERTNNIVDESSHTDHPLLFGAVPNSWGNEERQHVSLPYASQFAGSQIGRLETAPTTFWPPTAWHFFSQAQQQPRQSQLFPQPVMTSRLEVAQRQLQPEVLARPTWFDRWTQTSGDGAEMPAQLAPSGLPPLLQIFPLFGHQVDKNGVEQSPSTPPSASSLNQEDVGRFQQPSEPIVMQQQQFHSQGEPTPLANGNFPSVPPMFVPIRLPMHWSAQGHNFGEEGAREKLHQAQQSPPPVIFFPLPNQSDSEGGDLQPQMQFPFFKAPEERIQTEAPTQSRTFEPISPSVIIGESGASSVNNNNWQQQRLGNSGVKLSQSNEEDEDASASQMVKGGEGVPRGWTHQASSQEASGEAIPVITQQHAAVLEPAAKKQQQNGEAAKDAWVTGPTHFPESTNEVESQEMTTSEVQAVNTRISVSKAPQIVHEPNDAETSKEHEHVDGNVAPLSEKASQTLFIQVDEPNADQQKHNLPIGD